MQASRPRRRQTRGDLHCPEILLPEEGGTPCKVISLCTFTLPAARLPPRCITWFLIYLDTGKAVICLLAAPSKSRPAQECHAKANHSSLPAVPGIERRPELGARSIQVSQGFGDNSLQRTCFTSHSPPVNNSSNTSGGGELPWAEWEEAGSQASKTVIKTPPSGCSQALSKEYGRVPCSFQPFLDILD